MNSRKCLIMFFSFFVLMNFYFAGLSYAQDAQCGNGMIQQLKIGNVGRVPLDEPTPSTLRSEPGGQGIGYIQPGETFAVLDGPQCTPSTGTSWWYVQINDFSEGWISEGNKGDYWIEPFSIELYLKSNSDECKGAPPPRLNVGSFARILQAEKVIQLDSIGSLTLLHALGQALFNPKNLPVPLRSNEQLLVVEGPICFNKEYIWRFQPENSNFRDIQFADLWINEAVGTTYNLEPTIHNPVNQVTYIPATNFLDLEQTAPIIDSQSQIAVAGFGGDPGCFLDEWDMVAFYASPSLTQCVEIVFFPNTPVEARFYYPDGTLYSHQEVVTTEYPLTPGVGFYRFGIPNDLNLPEGIWKIDFLYNGIIWKSKAYELKTYPKPQLEMGCDGAKPVIEFTGFTPNENIELALTTSTTTWEQRIKEENGYVFYPSHELHRWNVTVGSRGELAGHIEFPLIKDNENEELYFQIVNTELQAIAYPFPCVTTKLKSPDFTNLIAYGDITTGYIDFDNPETHVTFTGKMGENIDINAMSFISGKPDLLLQLKSPDGTLVAENDNSLNPRWGQTDPEIVDYRLAENGDYHIVVKSISGGWGWFTLMLNHPQ